MITGYSFPLTIERQQSGQADFYSPPHEANFPMAIQLSILMASSAVFPLFTMAAMAMVIFTGS